MTNTWQPKQRDDDGLYLKDRIWRHVCQSFAENNTAPEWSDVKVAIAFPTGPDERKQRSHYSAAIKYMTTGSPPRGKTIPKESEEFVRRLRDVCIGNFSSRNKPSVTAKKSRRIGTARQADPFRRQEVERAAVEFITRHFTDDGYSVDSKEQDNVGWDLEAVRDDELLRLEVKGLSGSVLCIELTPNEYEKMNSAMYRDSYRLCVVTNALSDPQLVIFAYSKKRKIWIDESGRQLAIEEIIAARCRMETRFESRRVDR